MSGLRPRMVLAGAVVATLVCAIFALLLSSIDELRASARSARHSEEVIGHANALEKLVLDLETGQRGFVITHEERFLEPWRAARRAYPREAKRLEALVAGNAAQEHRAREIAAAIESYYAQWSLPVVRASRRSGAEARALVAAGGGKRRVDAIRARFTTFVDEEQQLAEKRRRSADSSGRAAIGLGIGGVGLSLLLLLAYFGYLTRAVVFPVHRVAGAAARLAGGDLSQRVPSTGSGEVRELGEAFNQMAAALQESHDELESQNAELELQTAELEDQQARLAEANEELQARHHELEQALAQLDDEKRHVEALYEFDERIARETDVTALAEVVLDGLAKAASAEAGAVYLLDETGHKPVFSLQASRAFAPGRLPPMLEPGAGLAGRALLERRRVAADHGENGLRVSTFGDDARVGAELHVPLAQGGRVLGVVSLARLAPRPFAEQELALVEHLSAQAAVAAANAISLRKAMRLLTFNEALLDKTPLGIRLVDLEGHVLLDNAVIREIVAHVPAATSDETVYERAERIGAATTRPDEYVRYAAELAADPGLETTFEFEYTATKKSYEIFTSPVEDRDGNRIARLFVLRDVTAERAADRLKSELMATVSHELRTPLASILGFAELLAHREVDAATRARYVETIYGEARRLTALINDFLDLQRIEAGPLALALEPFELRSLLEQEVELFSGQSGAHRLELSLPPEPLQVRGDRKRTAQVVANLLSNAIKYSPAGGTVTVGAARVKTGIRVEVRDQGLGIPAPEQDKIFTKFFRVDSSDTREIGGTGLGLALSREIVAAQGGRIGFDSVEGEGSTFWFELPAAAPGTVAGPHALVVEDDAAAAALIVEHLESEGLRAEVVASGEEALERAAATPPLLVCLDIALAGEFDGWQVLSRLKGMPATAHVPVIVCTAGNGRAEAVALGAADFLAKPFSAADLRTVVRRLSPAGTTCALVVDDEPAIRELVRAALVGDGLEVAEAADGAAALASVARRPPDVIVLDLMMPVLDGFSVLERLQEDPQTRSIPVVVLTARRLTPAERSSLGARTGALLEKSAYSGDELRRLIRLAVGTRTAGVNGRP